MVKTSEVVHTGFALSAVDCALVALSLNKERLDVPKNGTAVQEQASERAGVIPENRVPEATKEKKKMRTEAPAQRVNRKRQTENVAGGGPADRRGRGRNRLVRARCRGSVGSAGAERYGRETSRGT